VKKKVGPVIVDVKLPLKNTSRVPPKKDIVAAYRKAFVTMCAPMDFWVGDDGDQVMRQVLYEDPKLQAKICHSNPSPKRVRYVLGGADSMYRLLRALEEDADRGGLAQTDLMVSILRALGYAWAQ
jgi:hypothetical protein